MHSIAKFYKKKRVLITGATGFKGAWLCAWLLNLGSEIKGVGYIPNSNQRLFNSLGLAKKVRLSLFDIRNKNKLESTIKKFKPSILFHLAAQPLVSESYKKPYDTFDINFRGTLNLIDISMKYRFIKSIISVTSDKCYENLNKIKKYNETDRLGGIDPYSASKASAELLIRSYRKSFYNKVGISSVRAGNVIGGGDWSENRLIPDSVRYIQKNLKIRLRNPNYNRPWQFVLEPLKGYLVLAKKQYEQPKRFSSSWNFGPKTHNFKSVKNVVELIIKFWGKGSVTKANNKFHEHHHLQLNCDKAKKKLKWKPVYNVNESIKKTIEWYYKVLNKKKDPKTITNEQIHQYMKDSNWL